MTRIFVLPDCQVRPDVPTEHLDWIGRAICHYSPDVVVCLGDFADMESLSSYKTRKEAEGLRYHALFGAMRMRMPLVQVGIL